jgi:nicotinate-nucleotide adenylyltransferase
MRIALFGGSFDPPHLGHVLAACYAKLMTQVDAVWVLPVAKHAYQKDLSPWDVRWQLCQAAFADLPFVTVRDDELRNPSGFTFDLLTLLTQAHPEHTWFLVGGSDTAMDLPNWHRGNELATRIQIIPVPRRGFKHAINEPGEHIGALPAISSSLIRERLANGQPIDDVVPTTVANLIKRGGWYPPHA